MNIHPNRKQRVTFSVILAAVIILLTVSMAYAAFFTINTDDGSIDSNWPATPFLDDPTGDTSPNFDIDRVWFGTNADPPTQFYFRADLVGELSASNGDTVEARLDCNGNGSFTDAADVIVAYLPDLDKVNTLQADDWNPWDSLDTTHGEFLAAGNNYEWRAPASGTVDWSACAANPLNVLFATLDYNWVDQDTTIYRGYNVPSAVRLREVSAHPSAGRLSLVLVGLAFVVSGVFILLQWAQVRRRVE